METTLLKSIMEFGSFGLVVFLFLVGVLKLGPAFLTALKESQADFRAQLDKMESARNAHHEKTVEAIDGLKDSVQGLHAKLDAGVCAADCADRAR